MFRKFQNGHLNALTSTGVILEVGDATKMCGKLGYIVFISFWCSSKTEWDIEISYFDLTCDLVTLISDP